MPRSIPTVLPVGAAVCGHVVAERITNQRMPSRFTDTGLDSAGDRTVFGGSGRVRDLEADPGDVVVRGGVPADPVTVPSGTRRC